jgi:hypothetical protein
MMPDGWQNIRPDLIAAKLNRSANVLRDGQSRWMKPINTIGDGVLFCLFDSPVRLFGRLGFISKMSLLPIWPEEPIRATCFVIIIAASLLIWRISNVR